MRVGSSKLFFRRHPYGVPALLCYDVLDALVNLFWRITLDDRREKLSEIALQLERSLERLTSLLLRKTLVHLQHRLQALGLQEDGDRVQLCHVETFYGVRAHVQYAMFSLKQR